MGCNLSWIQLWGELTNVISHSKRLFYNIFPNHSFCFYFSHASSYQRLKVRVQLLPSLATLTSLRVLVPWGVVRGSYSSAGKHHSSPVTWKPHIRIRIKGGPSVAAACLIYLAVVNLDPADAFCEFCWAFLLWVFMIRVIIIGNNAIKFFYVSYLKHSTIRLYRRVAAKAEACIACVNIALHMSKLP